MIGFATEERAILGREFREDTEYVMVQYDDDSFEVVASGIETDISWSNRQHMKSHARITPDMWSADVSSWAGLQSDLRRFLLNT